MTLFDEVQQIGEDSHEKWFERYCKKIDLENRLKIIASQGRTSGTILITDKQGEYLRGRLLNPQTLDMLRTRLGKGFSVELKTEEIENPVFSMFNRTKTYIEISW